MAVLDTLATSLRKALIADLSKALTADLVSRLDDGVSEVQATACDTLRALNVNIARCASGCFRSA